MSEPDYKVCGKCGIKFKCELGSKCSSWIKGVCRCEKCLKKICGKVTPNSYCKNTWRDNKERVIYT